MARILLIVGGGIAAYKASELIRLARKAGHSVVPVLTAGGAHFVTPMTLAALAESPVYTSLWDLKDETEMGHIQLSRAADLILVCPATADLLAKMAAGIADDLATTLLLATDKPVVAAPAMNVRMWQHEATRANVATLQARGVTVLDPDEGEMACGEYGPGRLPEPAAPRVETQLQVVAEPAAVDRLDHALRILGVGLADRAADQMPDIVGAWLNGQPIRVTQTAELIDAVITSGFPYDKHTNPDNNLKEWAAFLRHIRGERRLGSAALDLCYVAAGRLDGYWEKDLKPWDAMAGLLIVREAGGTVTDYAGGPNPQQLDRGHYVASNGRLHDAMLRVLASA